jgi:hypothetical protein
MACLEARPSGNVIDARPANAALICPITQGEKNQQFSSLDLGQSIPDGIAVSERHGWLRLGQFMWLCRYEAF